MIASSLNSPSTDGVRVWVATQPVDMWYGRSWGMFGSLFVFRNHSAQRVKSSGMIATA
jgi:hypothetical protein